MHKFLGLFIALAALIIAVVVGYQNLERQQSEDQPTAGDTAGQLRWTECDHYLYTAYTIQCGRFYPGGDSGRFFLPFAIVRAVGDDRQPEPLVYISGGPGGGMETGADNLQGWLYWLEEVDLKRDLVIYDQRGLRPGEPYWDCEPYNSLNYTLLTKHWTLEEEHQMTAPVLEECFAAFDSWLRGPEAAVPAGVKSFSTPAAVRDLTALLQAVGYEAWNLWGVSYGSRLALVAAQAEPERVESLILDSVYPLDKGRLSDKPALYAQALQRFWQLCRNEASLCGGEVEDPEALYWRVADKLAREPRTFRVRAADHSRRIPVVLNDHRLFALTLFSLYDHRLYPELLQALQYLDGEGGTYEESANKKGAVEDTNASSANGNPAEFLLTLFISSALDPDFNSLLFYAIECNDNPLEDPAAHRKAALAEPALYNLTHWDADYNPCQLPYFEHGSSISPDPQPVAPALILAGALDPVTPASWAQSLADDLPAATLKIVPNIGHAVFSSGGCDPKIIEHFIQASQQSAKEQSHLAEKYCP